MAARATMSRKARASEATQAFAVPKLGGTAHLVWVFALLRLP
eukprot:COSAG05_NODE_9743_length_604_cov_6.560455_1_plen_41_part_10